MLKFEQCGWKPLNRQRSLIMDSKIEIEAFKKPKKLNLNIPKPIKMIGKSPASYNSLSLKSFKKNTPRSNKLASKASAMKHVNAFTKPTVKINSKFAKLKEVKVPAPQTANTIPPDEVIPPEIAKIKLDVKEKIKKYFKEK